MRRSEGKWLPVKRTVFMRTCPYMPLMLRLAGRDSEAVITNMCKGFKGKHDKKEQTDQESQEIKEIF